MYSSDGILAHPIRSDVIRSDPRVSSDEIRVIRLSWTFSFMNIWLWSIHYYWSCECGLHFPVIIGSRGEQLWSPHVDRVWTPIRPVLLQGEHNATCHIQNHGITYRYWKKFCGSDHTNCISAYYLGNAWQEPDCCASSLLTPFYL